MSSPVLLPKRYFSQAILAPIDIVSRTIPCNRAMPLTYIASCRFSLGRCPGSRAEIRTMFSCLCFYSLLYATHIRFAYISQPSQTTTIPCRYSPRALADTFHIQQASACQPSQTIEYIANGRPKLTISHETSEAAPINSVDAMFDSIVMQERKTGVAIYLHNSENLSITPINGRLLDASDEYKAAMQRRLARLLNNRPGKERLHWESESFAMNLRSLVTGQKCVRYIPMHTPITEGELCDCGCGKKDHECVRFRKVLSMVFVFDTEPVDLA
jgi:hypothetical protein